jgi:tetraacyldisaccharide 4'-kinase
LSKNQSPPLKYRFQQMILRSWYNPISWTLLLLPLSWLFQLISRIRRYNLTLNQKKNTAPVIVIGNITIGGSGKTPLVIHLAKLFSHAGYKVGIISRGYGRIESDQKPILVTPNNDASEVGDEPVIIVQQTQCAMVIGRNRIACIEKLLSTFPSTDIILSDDGLQHYKMSRDIEIAVINGNKRFGNGFCLPAGPLREPVSRLNQVDYVIASHKALADEYLLSYHLKSFVSLDPQINSIPIPYHSFTEVHAVAGIGEPAAFFSSLEGIGIKIIKHTFPDHHSYKISDLDFGDDLPIIMTEKDAVKCKMFNLKNGWFLTIETSLPQEFESTIKNRIKGLLYGKKTV